MVKDITFREAKTLPTIQVLVDVHNPNPSRPDTMINYVQDNFRL